MLNLEHFNSICSLQKCGSSWPFPIQTLFIYVIIWYPFYRNITFNQSIFSENFRGIVQYVSGFVLSCSLHGIHSSSRNGESKNGILVLRKGSEMAHEKENVWNPWNKMSLRNTFNTIQIDCRYPIHYIFTETRKEFFNLSLKKNLTNKKIKKMTKH